MFYCNWKLFIIIHLHNINHYPSISVIDNYLSSYNYSIEKKMIMNQVQQAIKKMNDFIKKFKEYEKQINIMLNVDYLTERN